MPDFSYLKKHDITGTTTTWYVMVDLDPAPRFQIAPATEVNKPFFNALLRRNRRNAVMMRAGKITSQMLEATREEDRVLYAKHVIIDWKGVTEQIGVKSKDVKFSPENCQEFLQALPAWIFDKLRIYCQEPSNFALGADGEDEGDITEQAGNSVGG